MIIKGNDDVSHIFLKSVDDPSGFASNIMALDDVTMFHP